MSDGSKKVLEKKAHGEYEFTAYGEFLSYFHAHIDIFKKLLKARKMDPAKVEEVAKQIKSYMTGNIKKTDQFFEHLPQFATMLGVPQNEVSTYLNSNFIEVLNKVQEKLKAQELEKINNAPVPSFSSAAEEIVERLQVTHPKDFVFVQKGILTVLENPLTGEIIEPRGLMAESAKAALSIPSSAESEKEPVSLTDALAVANAPPTPVVKKQSLIPERDKSILLEIVETFGENLTGELLDVKIGPDPKDNPLPEPSSKNQSNATQEEEYEIEDLEFDDSDSSGATNSSHSQTDDADDFSQDIDVDFEEEEPETPLDPNLVRLESFNLKEFMDMIQTITGFQTKSDQVGYQNWLRGLSEFEKAVVSLRTQVLKEQKNEPVDWNAVFQMMSSKSDLSREVLSGIVKKIKNFQIVKLTLDRMIQEFKKGSPEFMQMVKMAWPHIQKAFFEVPNYTQVQTILKGILSRVNDENHKRDFSKIFTMALNFIQSKFQA
ncbi:hypothetical protein ND861_08275 [Leptospira sp. 2 VSF19]|uniref:Uncharacterized protein n=1 Tax=Leptospira soteropolitanensis TaxID=2950025 RepID=A0AAW5VKC7_9LEPT|nr:hypothetical protein [Leptospira soteropolitanensis]MCW7492991.1 hypothetical protein [Leptospira soteropolitanensis]MCW7500226.1 hypothetical protein [Leptospira soteropolitanensis]MCW7522477.1 hypothetical protein [Leptospira soteropolitanensis]MCW7526333.1 hypothetical protein [Leptospira soteropolitanensis]MCW7529555.1 hypothetical protein [Leptospira soteropolitanensis]